MAKIYISYQREDQPFVIQLAERLKASGHTLSYDVDELSPGTDWRTALDSGLKSSEIFIVVLSKSTHKSQYVLTEVGAARAYALESNRMLLIPIVIDEVPLPLSIQDIHSVIQPDRNLDEIIPTVERAISAFIGRRAALESAASEAAEKIQSNAADYIRVAINSLQKLESRDRVLSYIWYFLGFASLLLGIGFALWGLANASHQTDLFVGSLILVVLKAIVVIGLLGACAKYAFSLGKSYSSESLKSSDRIHAIRFGEFYLRAFGDKTRWQDLKEVFQHWNIDRNSSFNSLDSSQIDPKVVESLIDLIRAVSGKSGEKAK
ncbi:toll/interleukin-1 receptor domain-containing protein [Vibrio fluvialis]|nr:toll/interleukin-1 receptor domain-containing protein [Vibrio fluvialis]ELP2652105.1 toll/interleukin-1 receptor domain-containing protein [Vibrio fluvialis]